MRHAQILQVSFFTQVQPRASHLVALRFSLHTLIDIKNKFPLAAKNNKSHKSKFKVLQIEFGGKLIPVFAGPNMVESKSLIFDVAKNIKKMQYTKRKKVHLSHVLLN